MSMFMSMLILVFIIWNLENDAWDPISISDDSIIVEARNYLHNGLMNNFTQRITASCSINGDLMASCLFAMMDISMDYGMIIVSFQKKT